MRIKQREYLVNKKNEKKQSLDIIIDIKEQKGNPGFNPITSNRSPIKYQSTQNPGFLKTKQKKKKKLIKLASKNKKKNQVFEEKNYQRERTRWESGRI